MGSNGNYSQPLPCGNYILECISNTLVRVLYCSSSTFIGEINDERKEPISSSPSTGLTGSSPYCTSTPPPGCEPPTTTTTTTTAGICTSQPDGSYYLPADTCTDYAYTCTGGVLTNSISCTTWPNLFAFINGATLSCDADTALQTVGHPCYGGQCASFMDKHCLQNILTTDNVSICLMVTTKSSLNVINITMSA